MSNNQFRLSKKARTYMYRTYHLMPHEVIGAEIKSMQLRLQDAQKLKAEQQQLLESTVDRQSFQQTLKVDLPATERLISRLQEEIDKAKKDFNTQFKKTLRLQNTK